MNADFSYQVAAPSSQQAAFDADSDRCHKEFEKIEPPVQLTRANLKVLFAKELATMKCLQRNGLWAGDPPTSESQYADEYLSRGYPSWQAYHGVADGDHVEAEKLCPQPMLDQ